ncbi:putative cytoplasmic protein [Candidatus Sodalis pierantonius str. SOPE]|uniref:Putative cytoplasmic protein n=2 Tax=Sodalis TaxID=84565 RepID=W0HP56_9GAMM|nr:putative cytoplasmic protein [Candidatus Sodalis pierantonius str. SOPE]
MSCPLMEAIMAEHRSGSGNFAEDKQKTSEAGKKGGQHSGSGGFKNDPQKASEAGKKGGMHKGK